MSLDDKFTKGTSVAERIAYMDTLVFNDSADAQAFSQEIANLSFIINQFVINFGWKEIQSQYEVINSIESLIANPLLQASINSSNEKVAACARLLNLTLNSLRDFFYGERQAYEVMVEFFDAIGNVGYFDTVREDHFTGEISYRNRTEEVKILKNFCSIFKSMTPLIKREDKDFVFGHISEIEEIISNIEASKTAVSIEGSVEQKLQPRKTKAIDLNTGILNAIKYEGKSLTIPEIADRFVQGVEEFGLPAHQNKFTTTDIMNILSPFAGSEVGKKFIYDCLYFIGAKSLEYISEFNEHGVNECSKVLKSLHTLMQSLKAEGIYPYSESYQAIVTRFENALLNQFAEIEINPQIRRLIDNFVISAASSEQ